MGRTRKPLEKHLLDGTYRADRHGPLPDEGETHAPPVKPDGMIQGAGEFWDTVLPLLGADVRDRDAFQLQQMCSWWFLWTEAEIALLDAEIGTIEYSRTMNAATVASQNFDRIASRFGLTPADRTKLRADSAGPVKARVASRPKTKLDRTGPPKGKP